MIYFIENFTNIWIYQKKLFFNIAIIDRKEKNKMEFSRTNNDIDVRKKF